VVLLLAPLAMTVLLLALANQHQKQQQHCPRGICRRLLDVLDCLEQVVVAPGQECLGSRCGAREGASWCENCVTF
jgi:hypothetical protein